MTAFLFQNQQQNGKQIILFEQSLCYHNNIMNQNEYHSNTTCSKSPVLPQIASYLVLTLETVLFYSVVVPNFDSLSSKITYSILYSITLVTLFISGILSSICDPSDPVMIRNRNSPSQQFEQFRRKYKGTLLYCEYCRSLVQQKSRHCKKCDRCVLNFDHHCMWINNCIGELNYKYFFIMILSAFSNLLVYVIAVIALTIQHRFQDYFGGFIAAWISGVINSIFVLLLVNLIILHLYLINNGMSTYEFIMASREQDRKKNENKQNTAGIIQIPKKQSKESNDAQQNSQQHLNQQIQMVTSKEVSNTNIICVKSSKSNSQSSQNAIKQQDLNDGREVRSILFKEKSQSQKSVKCSESQNQKSLPKDNSNNDDSDAESGVEISQLFTRNKSLKFIIGKSDSSRPHKIKRFPHHSLIVGERQYKLDPASIPKRNSK